MRLRIVNATIVLLSLLTANNCVHAEDIDSYQYPVALFEVDTPLMNSMLDNSTSFTNEFNILDAKPGLVSPKVIIGGYMQGGFNRVSANKPTFIYTNNLTYQSRNYLSLDRADLALIANVNPWSTVYLEVGAADLGEAYVANPEFNQAYLLLGNGTYPLYGFMGYKNIDFGNFSTVNMFAQPVTRWDYAGTGLTVGGGFRKNGFNLTLSALRGGTRGVEDYYGAGIWRVHIYPNYYTANGSNYALNTSYEIKLAKLQWNIGAGYMRGLWLGNPINSFDKSTIGAWDVNSQLNYQQLTLLAEYVQSIPRVGSFGSFATASGTGIFLKTFDVGAKLHWHDVLLPHESSISADFSGVLGNASFANVKQWVFGINNNVLQNLRAGIEYVIDSQTSNQDANRSGIFYRAHNRVQSIRLDLAASF